MIHPKSRLLQIFHGVIILLAVFSAIEVPLRIALQYDVSYELLFLDWLITVFFAIDIIFNFNLAYDDRGKFISDRKLISRRYLKSWFTIDILATIPFEILFSGFAFAGHRALRMIRLTRLARLLKLVKLKKISKDWHTNRVVNQSLVRLVFFAFWVLLFSHWIACGWILMEGVNAKLAPVEKYVDAIYWSVTTLTTVGYGDLTPDNMQQKIYTMLVMFLGVGLYGYVIGNVSTLLANTDVAKANYVNKIEELSAFFTNKQIPFDLQDRIKGYYNHLWQNGLGQNELAILTDLPQSLRTDIILYLSHSIIQKVPLFKKVSGPFLRAIALALKPEIYLPGSYVIRRGEFGDKMFFIFRGTVTLTDQNGKYLDQLTEGQFFGETALITHQSRNADVTAQGYCDLYSLDKKTFDELLKKYPKFAAQIQATARKRSRSKL